MKIEIECEYFTTYSLAAQQNGYSLFRNLTLHALASDETNICSKNNLSLKLSASPALIQDEIWEIDSIQTGQSIRPPKRPLDLTYETLSKITEETLLNIDLILVQKGEKEEVITSKRIVISILPENFWGGETRQPDLLAAFVRPNGIYVESLVKKVTEILEKGGYGRSADGYQSQTREKPYQMAAALWNVIFSEKISYVSPAPGFAHQGQRIRSPAEISSAKIAACLDTTILFASCLELMGLNTVVALFKEHAVVGVWLIDQTFPVLTNDDVIDLRKRCDARDIVLFETTLVTNSNVITFNQAKEFARTLLEEEREEDFVYLIDIKQARSRKIKPLSGIQQLIVDHEADNAIAIELPPPPPLPPVTKEEQQIEQTPLTRIDGWQRKLLDLTKRNPLLSMKGKSVSIRMFCPDVGLLEDRLADGGLFSFLPVDKTDLVPEGRSLETYRLKSGEDLHREFAIGQLNKNILLANMAEKDLVRTATNLFRKAKNDLEEGGANTLYLALGFLKWKDNPEDEKSHFSPLILIPAQLSRKSAKADIKLRQLPEEQPLFNMTLIEFLDSEHNIDLNIFRETLPEDESGVDVKLVWDTVRDAISDQPGFEVVEDLVLSSFSFAKYLMWKDLKDRVEILKENLFVNHLIETPSHAYNQDTNFILRDEIDEKIDPSKIFAPLNCDSSQLVAVEASGHNQDFVLEGPPGTGKSETIANIICHNIAQGRKVLFVAEKMVALQVVYRRMEKIGLDHLCLELHSNKSNKKAVLDQLRGASQKFKISNEKKWVESTSNLREKRNSLNEFVKELHKKSQFGVSLRDTISWISFNEDNHQLRLNWSDDLNECPISSSEEVEMMLEKVKLLAISYEDINDLNAENFRILNGKEWSNSWQTNVVSCLEKYKAALNHVYDYAKILSKEFNIILDPNVGEIKRFLSIVDLIEVVERRSIGFLFKAGRHDSLEKLRLLAKEKREFDEILVKIGSNITANILEQSPVSEWYSSYNQTHDSWIKSFIFKIKFNSKAKSLGYTRFKDLTVIPKMQAAKDLLVNIKKKTEQFEEDKIWNGWDTSFTDLDAAYRDSSIALKSINDLTVLGREPAEVFTTLKSKLVEGREFLSESRLLQNKIKCKELQTEFLKQENESIRLNIEFDLNKNVLEINRSIDDLVQKSSKYKVWSEWLLAKQQLKKYKIENVVDALEAGDVSKDELDSQVKTGFYRWLAPILMDKSDVLRQFKSSTHEQLIRDFRNLDAEVATTTSAYIAEIMSSKAPNLDDKNAPKELGVLARELQKKTRHKPVRTLISEMGYSLLELCPCLMMSPLSVAQFLPTNFKGFDLVIFDEASQMTPWDSIGAIARGKNVIIVGDPKQMPPTNFFNGSVNDDDPDEEDMESILDQALAARLPHKRLMGHYRSRHETLIAFSNSKYYENSLVSYPSADTKESAVTLHRVEGLYSKGKSRNNLIEAREVVKEVVLRLKNPKYSGQSIGIVTLNTEQKRTIEDLLDDARREYPEIEEYFHSTEEYDEVFVKNLESVQGDERDIIILSLGYGPTEPGAKTMSMNFGPLNKSGGERRLNVAITRATSEVLVFASFDSSMIDLSRTSARAVEDLKHYLEFAERGPKALAEQAFAKHGVDQFDSYFEEAVASQLRAKGWKVQTQIGVSKFRIDLGIIHPDSPGTYLAGVECDGATYHGSPSARDRDRIRQAVLENLGWKLIRLWSTDYFQDSEGSIDKVLNQLEKLLASDRVQRENQQDLVENSQQENRKLDQAYEDFEEEINEIGEYSSKSYFEADHKNVLINLAKEILEEKNGITLNELALDIAELHGLARTSKKQLEHLLQLLKPWAGLKKFTDKKIVVWRNKPDIVDEIPWRGRFAFGVERQWSDIPYPEALGLARLALEMNSTDPISYIINEFEIKRKHETTIQIFQSWIYEIS